MKVRRIDFSPDEWLAGTVGLDNAERGLYITACALIYSAGGPIPKEHLRAACRDHGHAFNRQLARLLDLGKLSINEGQIVNKRAINELQMAGKRSANARQNGAKRWNNNSLGDELALPTSNARARDHQPSTINHQAANAANAREARSSLTKDFAEFWLTYPHKVGKGAAEKAFATASKAAPLGELIEGVRRYAASKPDDHNWCNPATWLNQRRWEDQPADLLNPQGVNGHARRSPVEKLYAGAAAAAEEWDRRHGGGSLGEPDALPLLDR